MNPIFCRVRRRLRVILSCRSRSPPQKDQPQETTCLFIPATLHPDQLKPAGCRIHCLRHSARGVSRSAADSLGSANEKRDVAFAFLG